MTDHYTSLGLQNIDSIRTMLSSVSVPGKIDNGELIQYMDAKLRDYDSMASRYDEDMRKYNELVATLNRVKAESTKYI